MKRRRQHEPGSFFTPELLAVVYDLYSCGVAVSTIAEWLRLPYGRIVGAIVFTQRSKPGTSQRATILQ